MKSEVSVCTAIMLNDHSNPCIESTTVFSDVMHAFIRQTSLIMATAVFLLATSADSDNSRINKGMINTYDVVQ